MSDILYSAEYDSLGSEKTSLLKIIKSKPVVPEDLFSFIDSQDLNNLLRFPGILIEKLSDKHIGEEKLGKFSIGVSPVKRKRWWKEGSRKIRMDGNVALGLFYEKEILGAIALDKRWRQLLYGEYRICQIQASINIEEDNGNQEDKRLRRHNFLLEGFDWRKVLILIMLKYIREEYKKYVFFALQESDISIISSQVSRFDTVRESSLQGGNGFNSYDKQADELGVKLSYKPY